MSSRGSDPPPLKVCLAGKFGVGKTTIFTRARGELPFKDQDYHSDEFTYNAHGIKIKIVDTGGMEKHQSMSVGATYRNAVCLLFVYDVTNIESLQYINLEWNLLFNKHYCDEAKIVIIRNKIDLNMNKDVTPELEENTLKVYPTLHAGIVAMVDMSALLNVGVEDFFRKTLPNILNGVNIRPSSPQKTLVSPTIDIKPSSSRSSLCCN